MIVNYRIMYPHEEPLVHNFFLATYTAYPDEGLQNYRAWKSLPQQHTRTYVAVAPDQSILATVVAWYRQVHDATGTPHRVGHLSHVVTRVDARRQGHASRLVEQAITAMQHDGCVWSSLLTANAAARPLYEHYGWRSLTMPFWRGRLTSEPHRLAGTGCQVHRYDASQGSDGWTTLTAIYAEYNALRPLTVVRDQQYWQTFTAAQLADGLSADRVSILTAHHPGHLGNPCGYVLLHVYDEAFLVSEIGVRSRDQAAISALLVAVAETATLRGALEGEWLLPQTPAITATLKGLCGDTLQQVETDFIMVRPIAPGVTMDDLAAIFAASGAIWWRLDMV
jgi:predicted acetyltransferase